MELDPRPMDLAGLRWVLQNGHEQIADSLELYFAWSSRPRFGDESINPSAIKHLDPQPNHPIGAAKLLADRRPTDAHE